MKIVVRSPTVKAKVGRAIFQGILLGTMFFQLGHNQEDARNRFSLIFLATSSVVFQAIAVIPELFSQRIVYYSQQKAGYARHVVCHVIAKPIATVCYSQLKADHAAPRHVLPRRCHIRH